jgi:putative ABC transport system substrate-binding protein
MRRRTFIKLLASAAVAGPFAARGQTRPKRVGVLVIGKPDPEPFWHVFREAMRKHGHMEGENIVYEFRSAEGDATRLSALAAELVRLRVDAIVTWYTPTVRAAKDATNEIPIIMADAGDPVGTGLVASLARPGGNVTGVAGITAELAGKCVDLYRELLPSTHRLAALCNMADPFSESLFKQIEDASRQEKVELESLFVKPGPEAEGAFAKMSQNKVDGVIIQPSLLSMRVAKIALGARLPTATVSRWFAEQGGLMSYNPIQDDIFRVAADYTDRVLKGVNPATLPVQQPTKFELVVNRKTAQSMGIKLPDRFMIAHDVEMVG